MFLIVGCQIHMLELFSVVFMHVIFIPYLSDDNDYNIEGLMIIFSSVTNSIYINYFHINHFITVIFPNDC